jgi:hypothetical protein
MSKKLSSVKPRKKQHQDYNNVFQENLDEITTILLTRIFKLDALPTQKLPKKKITRTYYREPDILLALTNSQGEHLETIHGEVHLKDEVEISYRAAEYAAMEFREFRKPVRMFILYIGKGESKNILSTLNGGCFQMKIEVINMQQIPAETFLNSTKPEEVILSILGNFGRKKPEQLIREIILQLLQLIPNKERLQKYLKQLEILSNLRNLQRETIKQINNMALTYDIKTDLRYQQGIEQGVTLKSFEVIMNLILQSNHDDTFIAGIAGVEEKTVAYIRQVIKENPDDFRKKLEGLQLSSEKNPILKTKPPVSVQTCRGFCFLKSIRNAFSD